jgi:DNA modification methylase
MIRAQVEMAEDDHAPLIRVLEGDALKTLLAVEPGSANLIISSPPYNIGKIYERDRRLSFDDYIEWQESIISSAHEALADDGSICWQVGNYVKDGSLIPLDVAFFPLFAKLGMRLRNRIIWRFNFGHNPDRRFSGRYETILWFTKSDKYKFNLDPVRVPQIYPGKRHAKNKLGLAGQPSGNPKGKNPSDYWEFSAENDFLQNPIWDIPNVKAAHPEKTDHPCQFPIELAERCVLALTDPGDLVLDPFVGTGASVLAAMKHGRAGLGIDKEPKFVALANERIDALARGELPTRPAGRPVRRPLAHERVAQVPTEWALPNK